MKLSDLHIASSYNSAEINLDPETGFLEFKGKSIPENATQVFQPVVNWLMEYIKDPADETNLHLNLIYFNTASSIWIARIIKVLSNIDDREKLLIIHLYFHIEEFEEMEEEDLKEAISPATDVVQDAKVSIGMKIYGTDDNGMVIKERLILI
ncbi:MAG TPA: SiaC family regulatory phosphoprotein [Bacteroidales bacterium]|nr:SiaC family regulatory phosphoprotein [Bacteroidales bacterium]